MILPQWDVPRLAEALGASEETIREHIRQGRLKAYKQKGRWWMYDEDVDAYMKANPSPSPPVQASSAASMIPAQRPPGIPARARRR